MEDNYFIRPGTRLSPGPASQASQRSRNETIPPGGGSLFSMAVYCIYLPGIKLISTLSLELSGRGGGLLNPITFGGKSSKYFMT